MVTVIAFDPSIECYLPQNLNLSALPTRPTEQLVTQLHALSVKTSSISDNLSVSSKLIALYTHPNINNLEYAHTIFNNCIRQPKTLFSYNTLIKCCVQNHRSQDALVMFRDLLLGSSFLPDMFTFPCVIKACGRLNALQEGKMVHGLALKIGFGLDVFVQSSLVSFYSKCGDVDSAAKLFDRLRCHNVNDLDLVSWNALIDGYVKCGQIDRARELFYQMSEKDAYSWTLLIDGLSKSGRVEEARELFDRMPNKSLPSWNAMVNGYMKSGDVECARDLFHQMEERNLITWNLVISGYKSNGEFREALDTFCSMLHADVEPNVVTLVSTLTAISGLAWLSKGRWLHSYMVKNGHKFKLDGVLGTLLIEMYSKCGCIESCLMVFHKIPRKKLGHWTAIIVGLGMHGQACHALKLFSKMRRSKIKPNAITFIGVLNACNHAGYVDEGRRYFDMMTKEYLIEPELEHYGCLVDILCRAGKLDEAKHVVENMPFKPNKIIWMSLLSGARNHRNIEIGEYAAKHVIEMAPETVQSYVLLSNMYAVAGQWNKVSLARGTMKERGIKKHPGCSVIENKGELHEFIVGDKSHSQTDKIYLKLAEMRGKLRYAGYLPDTTQVSLFIEEEKEKEAELDNHSERLAIAFGLINTRSPAAIRIVKNLRVCNDCHSVTKLLSKIYDREIIVRDNSRFHHFKNGLCSCGDYW